MAAVFLVEDDQRIRQQVTEALTRQGHAVRAAGAALEAVQGIVEWSPDIVVLDLGLPDIDGERALGLIRAISAVPVIVATARDDEESMVRLLDAGADDYVVKPYSASQLEARVRAVLRRAKEDEADGPLQIGGLRIDPARREASLDGRRLELSRLEFDLLSRLAARQGEVVHRRELLADVWRQPYGGSDRTLDVHLSWLRRKLGETAAEPRYLHTVRGVGVKLAAPES